MARVGPAARMERDARRGTAFPTGSPPRVPFLSLSNDVGSDRAAAEMACQGADCAVLSPSGFYCARTRHVARRFDLPRHDGIWTRALFVRPSLEILARSWRPDLVVPLDDVSAWLLRGVALGRTTSARLRRLLHASLGAPRGYAAACSRARIVDLAARLRLRTPVQRSVARAEAAIAQVAAWGYPVVLKLDHTCGGNGVTIAETPERLRAALNAVRRRGQWLGRGRMAFKGLLWRLAGLREETDPPPMLQQFIDGTPAMRMVACWEGRVLAGVRFAAECVHLPPTGPSTVVRHIENAEMDAATACLVAELGCSGLVSFDFVLAVNGSGAHLIEMNPRPIGSGHLGRLFGHDVFGALAAQLAGQPCLHEPAAQAETRLVALFPKELERDPCSPWVSAGSACLHDVPWDDPDLVAAYLRRVPRTALPTRPEAPRRAARRGARRSWGRSAPAKK